MLFDYYYGDQSKMNRWTGNIAHTGEMRNPHKILVEKPEGRKPLIRPRHRCKDSIRMHLREIEWEVVDWIHVAQDRYQW
jgi:hypothetical protein